jgi:hypothetical protein
MTSASDHRDHFFRWPFEASFPIDGGGRLVFEPGLVKFRVRFGDRRQRPGGQAWQDEIDVHLAVADRDGRPFELVRGVGANELFDLQMFGRPWTMPLDRATPIAEGLQVDLDSRTASSAFTKIGERPGFVMMTRKHFMPTLDLHWGDQVYGLVVHVRLGAGHGRVVVTYDPDEQSAELHEYAAADVLFYTTGLPYTTLMPCMPWEAPDLAQWEPAFRPAGDQDLSAQETVAIA